MQDLMKYFIGALLGVCIVIIWFLGIHLTSTEARLRSLEFHQIGMESSLQIGVDRIVGAADRHTMEHRLINALAKELMAGT